MENEFHPLLTWIFLLEFCSQVLGNIADGEKACSCYTFISNKSLVWAEAKTDCERNEKHLVTMETEREWHFINDELKNRVTNHRSTKNEWHIGLALNSTTGNWTWINGRPLTINKWQSGKPDNNIKPSVKYALIAKEYPINNYGTFNSIRGDLSRAWICEAETDSCGSALCMSHNPTAIASTTAMLRTTTTQEKTSSNAQYHTRFPDSSVRTRITRSKAKSDTTLKPSTTPFKTTDKSTVTTFRLSTLFLHRKTKNGPKTMSKTSLLTVLPEEKIDESPSFTVIILILLAVIILAVLILCVAIFARRRLKRKQPASSSKVQPPSDRQPCLQSSTELTVHVSMSQTQQELVAFKTVNENKEEYAYQVVDESKRKSKCDQKDPSSSHKEGGKPQRLPNEELQSAEDSVLVGNAERAQRIYENNNQGNKKEHVYAVVHVQKSKATFCKATTSGEERLDATSMANSTTVGDDPGENLKRLSFEQGNELDGNVAADEQKSKNGSESRDHLYAVVDTEQKKQRTPQKPPPYRSSDLLYADMSHLPENTGGKINGAYVPTVYADIRPSF